MTESINCGYARVAARHFTTKYHKGKTLPRGSMPKVMAEYNRHFMSVPSLTVNYSTASKRFPAICRRFNMKWATSSVRKDYLETFGVNAWAKLSDEEKNKHTSKNCTQCQQHMPNLFNAFPSATKAKSIPSIKFTPQDLANSKKFGRKVLRELNVVTNTHFSQPIQDVLVETPKSKLTHRPTSATHQKQKRKIQHEMKKNIEREMDSQSTVLQNRISWKKFDKIRLANGLTSTPKRTRDTTEDGPPPTKKFHGIRGDNLQIDKEQLLAEATSWDANETINWSELGTKYGLVGPNRGQTIKEFLADNGIQAALVSQRKFRAPRRAKKRLCGGRISVPMPPPANIERQKLQERIESGEFTLGDKIVEQEYTQFRVTPQAELKATKTKFTARKIPLIDIRKSLLAKHENLGVLRANEDISGLTRSDIEARLSELAEEFDHECSDDDLREKLLLLSRKRHLKIWHDHSSVAGHSYLLALVTPIYDKAFYYTPEEMEQKNGLKIDVQALVEQPEIHILGRSGASIVDQMLFTQCRQECLRHIDEPIQTESGILIRDVVRFFHGDGPAQQFEGGHGHTAVLVAEQRLLCLMILHTATMQRSVPSKSAKSLSQVA